MINFAKKRWVFNNNNPRPFYLIFDKKEYLEKSEAEKVVAIMKLIDISIPLMQLSRVSGLYYNKLQKLRLGKEGKTVSLTYKRKWWVPLLWQ